MLSVRFQSVNIVSSTGDDCSNGADLYASISGLTVGRTYTLSISKTSDYGNAIFYGAPLTFLATSNELNNHLIKAVLLNARYFVLNVKITDDRNQTVYAEDITTVDCLLASTTPAETPTSTPTYTPQVTPTPTYSKTPTGTPAVTPSAQAYGVCIGTDKSSYSLDCCAGTAYSQHHKIVIGLVNLNISNEYSIAVTSSSNYIKTFISESTIFPANVNKLVDVYVSLNKNNTECAENKINVTVTDDAGVVVASRDIDIYCILSDSQLVPESYSCDNAVGVYFEDKDDFVCLHFDASCPRYIGNASVVPNFTPTPTQTKTPTVTPTYSRTPTISNSSDPNSLQSQAFGSQSVKAMASAEDTVNLKTYISPDNYDLVDSNFNRLSGKVNNSLTHHGNLYVCGNSTCNTYKGFAKTSAFVAKLNVSDTLVQDPGFGQQGIVSLSKMRANSDFDQIKIVESQNGMMLMCSGMYGSTPILSRFLASGAEDVSFGQNGHIVLPNVHHYSTHKIFDISIEKDGTFILFLDAFNTDNNTNVILICRLDFNGNLIELTPEQATASVKPLLGDFKYSELRGRKTVQRDDSVYVIFESFANSSKNTVIATKVMRDTYLEDPSFADQGYLYSSMSGSTDHTFVDAFIKTVNFQAAVKDDFNGYTDTTDGSYRNFNFVETNYDLLNIVVNNSDLTIDIHKYSLNGQTYSVNLVSLEPVSNDLTATLSLPEDIITLHSPLSIEEFSSIFTAQHIGPSQFVIDGNVCHTEIVKMPVLLDHGDNILIPVNVKVTAIDTIQDPLMNKNIDQFVGNSLLSGTFNGSGLNFRNCQIMSCDRQPEDSYGSIMIQNSNLVKFLGSERIYFGYIMLSNNLSGVTGVRIDSFDNTSAHNIVASANNYNGHYLISGHAGTLGNFHPYIKLVNLSDNSAPGYGPYLTDIIHKLALNNICG